MQQAIHIFKKDTRFLRAEICFVILLAVAFPVLWPVAAAYLIARSIHAEAIPGDNQFWITRPYRWTSLIAAKLLFIGVFVHLPVLLTQLYQVNSHGFRLATTWEGLLWSQILLILCLSLPAAALAAISSGMVAFMFMELVIVVIVLGLGQFSFLGLPSFRSPWPSGVEWMSNFFIISVAAIAAMSILVLQYYRRKTLVSCITAVSATVCGILIFMFLPPQFALNAEAQLTRPQVDLGSVELVRGPDPVRLPMLKQGSSSRVQTSIPITLKGLPVGVDIKADGIAGILQGSGGRTARVFASGSDTRVDGSGVHIKNVVFIDRDFFQSQRDQPVTLHASLYFSIFGNARSQTISQQPEPNAVMDEFRCTTGEFEHLVQFRCTSAFRWPGKMVYAQIDDKDPASFYETISYSPFPAELSLTPFESHSALGTQGLAPPSPFGAHSAPVVTFIAKRALAHVRRDLVVQGIRLSDLADFGTHPPPPPKK